MKRYRPTIPFASCKLAIDLEKTKSIQDQEGTPAYRCDCAQCEEWRTVYTNVIPEQFLDALYRIGLKLDSPTDLYGSGSGEEERSLRVVYHCVGRIREGLNGAIHDEKFEYDGFPYEVLRKDPYFSVRVVPEQKTYVATPEIEVKGNSNILFIDIRLCYPATFANSSIKRHEIDSQDFVLLAITQT